MINDNDKQMFRDSVDANSPIDKDGVNPKIIKSKKLHSRPIAISLKPA
jgi:hypothetical protein